MAFPKFLFSRVLLFVFLFVATQTPLLAATNSPLKLIFDKATGWEVFWFVMDQVHWWVIAAFFVGVLVLNFVACWMISRVVAEESGTLKNTALLYLYHFLALFVCLAWMVIVLYVFSAHPASSILLLPMILVPVFLAMKAYDIGFLKGVVFVVLAFIASLAIEYVGNIVTPPFTTSLHEKNEHEVAAMFMEWKKNRDEKAGGATSNSGTAVASESPSPAVTPPPDVTALYAALQKTRAELDVKNPTAVEKFNQQVAEYNAAKAKLTPPAPATPAPITKK